MSSLFLVEGNIKCQVKNINMIRVNICTSCVGGLLVINICAISKNNYINMINEQING